MHTSKGSLAGGESQPQPRRHLRSSRVEPRSAKAEQHSTAQSQPTKPGTRRQPTGAPWRLVDKGLEGGGARGPSHRLAVPVWAMVGNGQCGTLSSPGQFAIGSSRRCQELIEVFRNSRPKRGAKASPGTQCQPEPWARGQKTCSRTSSLSLPHVCGFPERRGAPGYLWRHVSGVDAAAPCSVLLHVEAGRPLLGTWQGGRGRHHREAHTRVGRLACETSEMMLAGKRAARRQRARWGHGPVTIE